jgi:aminopeptidase N
VVVGTPQASFEEEMQTMITFAGGEIDLDLLYHENMHQWWGDNVSEGSYSMTFFKEGLATLGEYLFAARQAKARAGGSSSAGRKAFHTSLIRRFDATYRLGQSFWTGAPSKPTSATLFSNDSTYQRPGASYIVLRQILGPRNFARALRQIQARYGGHSITESQLEAVFRHRLPAHSSGCDQRLAEFFHQWFDRAYAAGGGRHRPMITGPALAGPGFYATARCQKA